MLFVVEERHTVLLLVYVSAAEQESFYVNYCSRLFELCAFFHVPILPEFQLC